MNTNDVDKSGNFQAHWYVWYTKPRAEKKTKERLEQKGIEVFLPLKRELKQWSDRKKWVESPLFNGYIFIKSTLSGFETVTYTEGILNYVRFDGKPAVLREEEVENIKLILRDPSEYEIEDIFYKIGEGIEIISGPLQGLRGEIVSHRGNRKLAVRIDQLGKVILVQLPKVYVKRTGKAPV